MGVFPIQCCISTLYLKQARYRQLSQAWITCTPKLWICTKSRRYDLNFVIWGCQEHVRRHWFKRTVIKKYLWRKPTLEMWIVLSGWFAIIAVKYNSTIRWQVSSIYNIYVVFTGIPGKPRRISKLNNLFKEISTVFKMFIIILVFRVRPCMNTYTMCRVWWPEDFGSDINYFKVFSFSPSSELKLTTHNMLWKSWDEFLTCYSIFSLHTNECAKLFFNNLSI